MPKIIFNLLIIVSAYFFITQTAYARIDLSQKFSQLKDKQASRTAQIQDKIQAKKSDIIEKRCNILGNNLRTRARIHTQTHERYQKLYENIVNKVEKATTKLTENNCNADIVSQNLQTLKFKANELKTQHEALMQLLTQTQTQACTENPDIGGEKQKVREQAKLVREKALEIHNFLKNILRPHIEQARLACKNLEVNNQEAE